MRELELNGNSGKLGSNGQRSTVVLPIGNSCFNSMIPKSIPEFEMIMFTWNTSKEVNNDSEDTNIGRARIANGPLLPGMIKIPEEEDNSSSLNEPDDAGDATIKRELV